MKIAVTGAFGYSGRYIAERLLARGDEVLTLTNSVNRENPFHGKVRAVPFHFDQPDLLEESLRGAEALINTYWVRFNYKDFSHAQAVANTRTMFAAAKKAGVRRIVHVSITNPDIHSDLSYFKGKAATEEMLQSSGMSWCILRPAVLFGKEDVLINNIAWALRHLPVFGVYGKGNYHLQPIYVDDLAAAAVEKTAGSENEIIQAIGPETFAYRELVRLVRDKLGLRRIIIGVPPALGFWSSRLLGFFLGDVIITRGEIRGLMENRLCVNALPLGKTKLSAWIEEHKNTFGRRYTSELRRRTDRTSVYKSN